ICNQGVGGSNPFASSSNGSERRVSGRRRACSGVTGFSNTHPSDFFRRVVIFAGLVRDPWFPCSENVVAGLWLEGVLRFVCVVLPGTRQPHRPRVFAQVGEWLKPTDCKSVPPSEVRRFESFPVHQ